METNDEPRTGPARANLFVGQVACLRHEGIAEPVCRSQAPELGAPNNAQALAGARSPREGGISRECDTVTVLRNENMQFLMRAIVMIGTVLVVAYVCWSVFKLQQWLAAGIGVVVGNVVVTVMRVYQKREK